LRLSPQFQRLWLGQWLSNLGSQVSFYGLGLWLFSRADQLGPYAAVALVVQLGRLLVLPVLGRQLRQWPRRWVMAMAYGLGGCVSAAVALALWKLGSAMPLPLLLALLSVGAMAEAALVLSFATLIPQLVAPDQLGRANGLFATSDGLVYLLAPYLGALCAARLGLLGVLAVDLITFAVALLCLGLGRWPRAASTPLPLSQLPPQGIRSASAALLRQPRLAGLLVLGTALMAGFAAAELLFPAWVLSAFGADRLTQALLVSAGGYGLGSLLWQVLLAQRPGLWRGVFACGLGLQALVLTGAWWQCAAAHSWLWFFGVAVFNVSVPPVLAAQQSLWHRWIPAEQQPSQFAARYAWDWSARLLTVLLGGLLVDRWLVPLVGEGAGRALAVGLALVGLLQLLVLLLTGSRLFTANGRLA
jgi:DHA3 family macrolide efflux protein-like MFS transporter